MSISRSITTKVELAIWRLLSNGRSIEANRLRQAFSNLTGSDSERLSKFENYLDAFTFVTLEG